MADRALDGTGFGNRIAGWAKPAGALVVFTAASFCLFAELPGRQAAEAPSLDASGKFTDRLSFVQEDVPTRQTRIYDTLAMFSLPVAEAAEWSAPVASAEAAARTIVTMASAAPGIPVIQRTTILPPARPTQLAASALPPQRVAARPVPATVEAGPTTVASLPAPPPSTSVAMAAASSEGGEPDRLQVFGLEIPTIRYQPVRNTVVGLSAKAQALGSSAGLAVKDAGLAVKDKMSEVADVMTDTFRLR